MAFIRQRSRKDGSVYFSTVFSLADGTQTSYSTEDRKSAEDVRKLVEAVGGDKALEMLGVHRGRSSSAASDWTLTEYLTHYIDHLVADPGTAEKYMGYVRNDIDPVIGSIPLRQLRPEDIANWVLWLRKHGALDRHTGKRRPASAKTIRNKHGFLSGALNQAVPRYIDANPAAVSKLPQGDPLEAGDEMIFLTPQDVEILLKAVPEYWRPLVEFLVLSGCRWGEAAALRPGDIDRATGQVRIRRAWTYNPADGYRLVKPKGRSLRTINVAKSLLDRLDYSHEWLFVNQAGGPVRIHGFHSRVWRPAVVRSGLQPPPRIHDLRHTCASWLIAANKPLKVVQEHLGHQSIKTTMDVYGHLDRSSFEDAADALGKMLPTL